VLVKSVSSRLSGSEIGIC